MGISPPGIEASEHKGTGTDVGGRLFVVMKMRQLNIHQEGSGERDPGWAVGGHAGGEGAYDHMP